MAGHAVPAGWYEDPQGEPRLRYWDGERWTNSTAPLEVDAPEALLPPPPPQPSSPPPPPTARAPETLGRGFHDQRSPLNTFIIYMAVCSIVWWLGWGGLMAALGNEIQPTLLLVGGLVFGAVMAAIATPKSVPGRLEVAGPFPPERRQALRVAATELGWTVTFESADLMQLEPAQKPSFSVGGLSAGVGPTHIAVHFTAQGGLLVGPKGVINDLAQRVR
jgi:hypothetical protein